MYKDSVECLPYTAKMKVFFQNCNIDIIIYVRVAVEHKRKRCHLIYKLSGRLASFATRDTSDVSPLSWQ